MKKIGFIVLVLLSVSGCSSRYASNAEKSYLNSRNGTNLVVPPPLSSEEVSHFYDLPEQTQKAEVSIEPPNAK